MIFEDNIVGSARKCGPIEQGLTNLFKNSEFSDLGCLIAVKGKLAIPPYGTIDFNGFDEYQWEESFGLNTGWSWKANAFIFVKYLIAYHHNTGDDNALDIIESGIVSWLAKYSETDETYPHRFIWHDMGTGMRLESMLTFLGYIYQYASTWRQEHDLLRRRIITSCFQHATMLAKETFYTAYTNHGMYQMCQLLLAGTFFDAAPEELAELDALCDNTGGLAGQTKYWQNLAGTRLLQELKFSFTDEGVHVENSPAYHSFVFRTFMSLVQDYPASILGEELAATLNQLSMGALEFLSHILRPDKCLPIIGDTELLPVTDAFPAFGGTLAYGWFSYARTGGARGTKPTNLNKVYPKAGYAIFRDRWGDKKDYSLSIHLVAKAGCLSRYHHQKDEGNIILYAFGEDWLIDSGLYSHAHTDPVRIYMRSRAAHNVPLISPDASYSSDFEHRLKNWEISGFSESPDQPFVKMKISVLENILHERSVLYFREAGQIKVEDLFQCHDGQPRQIVNLWHVPNDKEVLIESENSIKIKSRTGNEMMLHIVTDSNFKITTAKGRNSKRVYSCVSNKFGAIEDSIVIKIQFDDVKTLSVISEFTLRQDDVYKVKNTVPSILATTTDVRPANVAILGSCITRDIFNYDEDGRYRVVDYTARTSLASAFSSTVMSEPSIQLDALASAYQRRQVERDINKLYPEILADLKFDVLIIDCIDERLKLYQNLNGALCSVSSELLKAGFMRSKGGRYILPCTDEFFSYWAMGWQRFVDLLREKKCLNKLYVNQAFWAPRDETGACYADYNEQFININNAFLTRMYDHMKQFLPSEQFLTFPKKMIVGDSAHRWGPSPFHYIDDYYKLALKKINYALTRG